LQDNRRNAAILPVLNALGQHSLKTANLDTLTDHLLEWFLHWERQWAHFSQDWWGRKRFTSYVREQRTLAKIADDILSTDRSKVLPSTFVCRLSHSYLCCRLPSLATVCFRRR